MDQPTASTSAPPKKGSPIRITLYQTFLGFSIAAAVLLLRHIDNQLVELGTKRATLFSLNRDLYVDDPSRLVAVQKPIKNPNELTWSVYIPPNVKAKLVTEGQTIAELIAGTHQIQARLKKIHSPSGPATVTIEKMFIDGVIKDVSLSIQDAMDDSSVTEPTSAALDEKLPLITKQGDEPEIQVWIEAQ